MAFLQDLLGLPDKEEERRPGDFLMSLMANRPPMGGSPSAPGGGGAPQGSELFELIYGGNKFNPSSADPSHGGHLHVAGNKIKKLGRWLQDLGFDVGENPAFGGVAPVHTDNSYHYKGKALDVNYGGGGRWENEAQALDWLERKLRRKYG